ncbi:MAG: hypothetical protein WCE68_11800 [Anaerolineales bacterium]
MSETGNAEFTLEVSEAGATEEELDQMTRQLLAELREMDVVSADLAAGGVAPSGTKAVDPVTLGAITMAVLPNFLPKIIDFIQAWSLRGQGRTVKFKGRVAGQKIEFEGSAADLQKVMEMISAQKGK